MNKRLSGAYRQGVVSIIVNSLLFAAKYYVGIVSGSVALITDAWHTFSDSLSSIVLIIGTKIAHKPADSEHPYGHGRAEVITALIIGIFLALIGFSFLEKSIYKLVEHRAASFGALAIGITIASVVVNELLAQYAFYLSRKTKNTSIQADGWHHRSDALSSLIILAGISFGSTWWWMDGVMGILMACFIFYASYGIVSVAINPLLGEKPGSTLVKEIRVICDRLAGKPIMAHHFHIHNYGVHSELTFHIVLAGDILLDDAHALADEIEKKIREIYSIEATIHIDPANDPETLDDIQHDPLE